MGHHKRQWGQGKNDETHNRYDPAEFLLLPLVCAFSINGIDYFLSGLYLCFCRQLE